VTFAEGEATLWPGTEKYRAENIEQSSARYNRAMFGSIQAAKIFAAVYDDS
jgi:hypothetical protein